EGEWRAEDHYPSAGMIEFHDGRPSAFTRTAYKVKPRAGTIVVFPSWLPHTVYPFRSAGERRSMSFNATVEPRAAAPSEEPPTPGKDDNE
ncbi:MAG: putative 2OG-Fe(II) oxygenase, partial [Acidobacteriota bacterium]